MGERDELRRLEIVRRINEIQSWLGYQRETTVASINVLPTPHPLEGTSSSSKSRICCYLKDRLQANALNFERILLAMGVLRGYVREGS